MPLIKGSNEAIRILREVLAAWPTIRQRLQLPTQIKGAPGSGVLIKQSIDGVTISAMPTKNEATQTNHDGSVWLKIKSASSVGTNQWNYKVRVMKSGDTSSHTGLVETADTTEFDARNTWETITLAGYENTSVTALKVIPNAAIVRGVPEVRNGVRVYVFSERNEPTC